MLFPKKKIICYVLLFDQTDIIRQTLDFLTGYANNLEIVAIENPSTNTPKIKKLVDGYGKAGLIKRYYLFDDNITGTAYEIVINHEQARLKKNRMVLLTDGDLTCKDPDWLTEEVNILKRNPSVFACGISLDMSNLPVAAFPEAKNWIPPDKQEHADFYETSTGAHLLLMRTKGLFDFMKWQKQNDMNFLDSHMHQYCHEVLGQKWARTKRSKAYHLTWDLYRDKSHPYTRLKTNKSFKETWQHKNRSDYKLTEY